MTWFETAGEAAAHRPIACFHARFPVFAFTA